MLLKAASYKVGSYKASNYKGTGDKYKAAGYRYERKLAIRQLAKIIDSICAFLSIIGCKVHHMAATAPLNCTGR